MHRSKQIFPSRLFDEYTLRAPSFEDMINVSAWNLVWGSLIDALLGRARASSPERALAITPGMTLIFLAFVHAAVRHKLGGGTDSRWTRLFALCGVSIFVGSWVLTLKIGTISAFWIIFHIVPGAGAIRAGDRAQLCVNLWVVSALILMIDRWVASSPTMLRNRRRFLAGAVLAFCVIEQVNLWSNGLARATELAELRAVPAPPRECHSFLVKYFGEVGESMQCGFP
jgi:hypothetical protein